LINEYGGFWTKRVIFLSSLPRRRGKEQKFWRDDFYGGFGNIFIIAGKILPQVTPEYDDFSQTLSRYLYRGGRGGGDENGARIPVE